jgi:hypothetical protein
MVFIHPCPIVLTIVNFFDNDLQSSILSILVDEILFPLSHFTMLGHGLAGLKENLSLVGDSPLSFANSAGKDKPDDNDCCICFHPIFSKTL